MKTLKEILETPYYLDTEKKEKLIPEFQLKEAAREWLNINFEDWFDDEYKFKCEKCGHTEMEWNYEGDYKCKKCGYLCDSIYLWIKHFFNLEE